MTRLKQNRVIIKVSKMSATSIEWTDRVWNPVTGCEKISAGCKNCYAAGVAKRFWGDRQFSDVQFHEDRLLQPFKWKKPQRIFVNSMSDLFHDRVTDEQLDQIFAVMGLCPRHTFQILTKRPERMMEYLTKVSSGDFMETQIKGMGFEDRMLLKGFGGIFPLPNVWLGVTVENMDAAEKRIDLLCQTPAAVRFLSCEPLLESINLAPWFVNVRHQVNVETNEMRVVDLGGNVLSSDKPLTNYGMTDPTIRKPIDWVIVGGESGAGARPCDVRWITSIVEQCRDVNVPVFVKQVGSNPVKTGSPLHRSKSDKKGSDLSILPEYCRVQEFPER